jgi:TetR/AcrR family transcriptional regulator, cholesterol catabolism regulator
MKAKRGEATARERILRAATQLFATKGFHATGVAEIGEVAGVGKGALYHHIQSKEDLLYDIVMRHVEKGLVRAEEILCSDSPPEEKLRQLCRHQLRTVAENQEQITIFFREQNALTGKRRQAMSELRHRVEDVWRKALQQGVDEGVMRSAEPVVVKGILGLINYSFVWYHSEGQLSPEQIADRLADLILFGVLLEPRAPSRPLRNVREPRTAGSDMTKSIARDGR